MPRGNLTLFDEPGAVPALGLLSSGLGLLSGQGAGQGISSVIDALVRQKYYDVLQQNQDQEQAAALAEQQERSRVTSEYARLGGLPTAYLLGSSNDSLQDLGLYQAKLAVDAGQPGEFTKLAREARSDDPLVSRMARIKGQVDLSAGQVSTAETAAAGQSAIDRRAAASLAQRDRESQRITSVLGGSFGQVQEAEEYDKSLALQGVPGDDPRRLMIRAQMEKASGLAAEKTKTAEVEADRTRGFEASKNIYQLVGNLEKIAKKSPRSVAGIGKSVAKITEIATSLRDPNAPIENLPGTATESGLAKLISAFQLGLQQSTGKGAAGRMSNQEQERQLQAVGDKLLSGNASLLKDGLQQIKELTRLYIQPDLQKTIAPVQGTGARAEDFIIQ